MHKLIPVSVLIAATAVFYDAAIAAQLRFAPPQDHAWTTDASGYRDTILLVGGMGGGTAGGMGTAGGTGGMTGGGMGGMTGGGMGGMTAGGMGGMNGGGMGNMPGGGMTGMSGRGMGDATGYGTPSAGGDPYGGSQTAADPPQSTQYYHCVTQHGQCSVSSTPGALRSGASCSCLFGGKGKIK
jgi:hypothetical protein